jgi:hypothetical protein
MTNSLLIAHCLPCADGGEVHPQRGQDGYGRTYCNCGSQAYNLAQHAPDKCANQGNARCQEVEGRTRAAK